MTKINNRQYLDVKTMYENAKISISKLERKPREKGVITPYDHVKNGLTTAATAYIQLVEGGMDPLDKELTTLRNTARNDLSALSIYFDLLDSNPGFAQAEMYSRLGFFPELSMSTGNSRLYVAKVKRDLKVNKSEEVKK